MNIKKYSIPAEPSLFDIHIAKFLVQRSDLQGKDAEYFEQITRQLSAAVFTGHSCLRTKIPELPFSICIDKKQFEAGAKSPLVYDNGRLYFYRYYNYEYRLAKQLYHLATKQNTLEIAEDSKNKVLDILFNGKGLKNNEPNLQRKAAEVALQKALTIISGGPGTGKTTTVVKILAAIITLAIHDATQKNTETRTIPSIALAAPTGKAAMRLAESIHNVIMSNNSGLSCNISKHIPTQASTLHRLLGVRHSRPDFIHNQNNPLDFDVVLIDEASMVDLALMSKLVNSLKPHAQLILLGDKDQLASVESGAVLSDIIEALPTCGVQLKKNWRFDTNIATLAKAVNTGNYSQVTTLFTNKKIKNLHHISLKDESKEWIKECANRYYKFMDMAQNQELNKNGWNDQNVATLFTEFNKFRILCALRKGIHGMEQVNKEIVNLLAKKYWCQPETQKDNDKWYPGRPVMITTNDYTLGLFNGDTGICLPDRNGEKNHVWFEVHSENTSSKFRAIPLNRLAQLETTFAMTIHKSQGSEFEKIAVILPIKNKQEIENTVLTKELLYTAITRAKKEILVIARDKILKDTINTQIERTSGLQEKLVVSKKQFHA